MKLNGKYYIPRQEFINWIDGVLLDRNEKGDVVVVNEKECSEAYEVLKSGGYIFLTENDNVVSKLSDNGSEFIEELIKTE
jgi:hypothetical protein